MCDVAPETWPVCNLAKCEIFVVPGPHGTACFDCIPGRVKSRYPGWEHRAGLRQERAQRASLNFTRQLKSPRELAISGFLKEVE
jgi:hypothetical protein